MKKYSLVTAFLILVSAGLWAQSPDYRVVFDITSKDTMAHHTVVRQVNGILKSNPDAKLEVVIYGGSLDLVTKDRSVVAPAIQELAKKVSFKVCAVTMQRYNIDKSQLIAGVETVPDGIYEIITKQKQGWGYIKVSQ
jgi:intracellular sulfur oxidation DsrE/DsrF family protein